MHFSPLLAELGAYPFLRLDAVKQRLAERGVRVIDFGVGDPREPTPAFIRQALVDGLRETMEYPRARGLPELRHAIADWLDCRFAVRLEPDAEVIPTLGAKEAIFTFPLLLVDRAAGRDVVVVPEPGYPVYERGARFAGAEVVRLALREEASFLPALEAVEPATWRRTALVWVNYPSNPTGALAPQELYERLAALAAEHGFLVASDESYSELYFDTAPGSALQVADRSNIVAVNTLSKRSSMTGYRAGFVAGSHEVVAALKRFRPTLGTAPQEFVQRAAVAAWGDETHVVEARERYRRKREIVLPALERLGCRLADACVATFYLWLAVPPGETSETFADRLLDRGIVVAPGSYLGPSGEGYVRLALVPTERECAEAAQILEEAL